MKTLLEQETTRTTNARFVQKPIREIVPEVFSGLEQLSALNLSHNQLYLLQPTAFSGLTTGFFNETPALTDLNLAGNIFSELPSSLFSAQRRLSKLDLSSNLLTSIDPQAFSGLYSLKELDLARNLLPSIEQGGLSSNWNYLPDLQMIDLSGNSIKQIDENAFQGLFSLKELRLKDMPALTHVQENGAHPAASQCIWPPPSQFALSVLNQRGGGNLKHLDLSYNQLSTLDSKLLDWQHLKWLNLAGNRWDCSCKMLEFLPAILRESQGGPAYCTLPDQLFNVQIKDIKSPRACNNSINDPLFTLLSLAAFLTILTLLTLLLLLCCCRHQNSGKLLSKCCSPSSSSNNQSRLPLYNTGSSFTESLIYEKGNVPLAKPPKSDPLIPNFTATIPRNMGVISNTEDSEGYYYSILPLGAGMNQASSQSTLRIGQLPNCQIAHAPYLLHNRSMVGLNRVLSNGYSRPPSFTAPPPPPVDLDRSRERLDEEGFEEMDDGYAARRYRTRSTEVV
uniref:LRRCT domain-containing protein n=1 Tax=Ditylenchus dipsaci TaxID=166011 RepID=A0A915DBN3_9BILA